MVIKASRRHRLAHHKQHAVMSGAHLVLEVVQALEYILWTRLKGAAQCTMSVQKKLAARRGQFFPASHLRQRCTEQSRRYGRGGRT